MWQNRQRRGYVADEAGSDAATARPLKVQQRDVRQRGVISFPGDEGRLFFHQRGGHLEIYSILAAGTDLPIDVRLEDNSGRVIASTGWPLQPPIYLTLPQGRFYLRVRGVGKASNGTDPGFSN
jgi:hypothetical protein